MGQEPHHHEPAGSGFAGGMAGAIVVIALIAVVVLVVLVAWQPWTGDGSGPALDQPGEEQPLPGDDALPGNGNGNGDGEANGEANGDGAEDGEETSGRLAPKAGYILVG